MNKHLLPAIGFHRRAVALAGAISLLGVCSGCSKSSFRPAEREGPPALVKEGGEPRFWLLQKQEEQRTRYLRSGRWTGKWITEIYYHFDLQAHDPVTTDRLWKNCLLTVKDDAGGHNAQARLLGQEGEVVWLFLNDRPVAVSSKDATRLADRKTIEERNPDLRDLIPKDLDFYAYDGGVVIVAADGRRFRVRASDFAAEPYTPPSDDHFRQVQFMATRWNGGYHTKDFLVRQAMPDGRWLGFFTEKEAAQAGNDEWGDHIRKPETVPEDNAPTRRTFWSARIGKTKEFTEGRHDRLFDVTRMPGAPEFLNAGLLIREGTREALRVENPPGFLVVHRTRLDEEGRLALARLDDNLKTQWSATLPFHDLRNRYEAPGRLLLYGIVQQTVKGVTGSSEHLVALDLSNGKMQSWNVPAEKRGE